MNITGHITNIDPIRTEFVHDRIPRGIAAVEITIHITPTDLQHLDITRPVELRQPDHPTKGNYRGHPTTEADWDDLQRRQGSAPGDAGVAS